MAFVQTGIWETRQVATRTAGPARMPSVSRAAAYAPCRLEAFIATTGRPCPDCSPSRARTEAPSAAWRSSAAPLRG